MFVSVVDADADVDVDVGVYVDVECGGGGGANLECLQKLTVKRPSEIVPTNLRTDTFFEAMVYRGRYERTDGRLPMVG